MPRLPEGYQWAATLAEATRLLDEGTVPVLRPAARERADRWANVLHTYPDPEPRPDAPPGARVVSLAGHEDLGELVAQALGRPHHSLDPAPFYSSGVLGRRGGSVLVVARAHALRLGVLMPLLTALAEQDTLAGFLTGRDDAACTFAAAKLLARSTASPARTGLLDGTTGIGRVLTAGRGEERSTIAGILAAPWPTLLVDAHGSAAHASLGAVTLCGLSGPRERTLDGAVLPGGCTPARCKTDPHGRTRPFAPHDLRARVLGLFVCNAITPHGGEQFPSDVNLALDAVEGYPQAILGLLRGDLDTSGHEPRLTVEALHFGARLGQCAALLDDDGARRGIRGPSAILLGDPEQRLHPGDGTSPARPAAAPGRAPARTSAEAEKFGRWRVRLADADAFEHALRAALHERPDQDLAACLKEMTAHRQEALAILLTAVRAPDGQWQSRMEEQSLRWAHATLAILSRTRGGAFSRQLTAARAHHRTSRWSPAPACGYCRAPREYEHLASPLGLTGRRTVRCPKCGPALSLPAPLEPLDVKVPQALVPGQPAALHVTFPEQARGLCAVHLRPRSTRRGSYDHAVLPAAPGRHTVTLTPPADPLPELDRLWVVHANDFHVAYHQYRLPLLPLPSGTDHPQ